MRIYLDHNATAPPSAAAVEALRRALADGWGNPSSAHAEGRRARRVLETARAAVAEAAGSEAAQVVFTSGGSEADALALRGLCATGAVETIVAWELEHPAVLETARALDAEGRAALRIVRSRAGDGRLHPADVAAALAGATRPLVAVMLAQNETGAVNDVAAIARAAAARGALVLCDAVQALGKVPVSFADLRVDALVLSAHKVGGAAGAGALILREGLHPAPFCAGGGQEGGRRQGTEPFAAAVAFGAAAREVPVRLQAAPRVADLRDHFEREVIRRVPGTRPALPPGTPRLPNTSALLFEGVRGADVVRLCDEDGLALSAGSACHAGAEGPSPVALALGLPESHRSGLVRASLGPSTSPDDVVRAAAILAAVATRARAGARADVRGGGAPPRPPAGDR